MASQDITNRIKILIARKFGSHGGGGDTILTGNIIDTLEFESIDFAIQTSAVQSGTSAQLVLVDGDEANLSDEASIDAAFLIGTEAETLIDTADTTKTIGYVGHKRFVRADISVISGGNAIDVGSFVILGNAHREPVN